MLIILLLLSTVISSSLGKTSRIIGGRPVDITEVPYIVSLHKNNIFFCGGSFIHKNWILTAAHCNLGTKNVTIRAGSSNYNSDGIVIPVEEFISHPDFDSENINYDFALIKLSDWNDEGIIYAPIPLPSANYLKIHIGSTMTVQGYGTTKAGHSTILMEVEIIKWDQERCKEAYRGNGDINDQMLCAGHPLGGKDACQGDSGGPLVLDGVLVGVVSFGFDCGLADYPGVYGRVSTVRDWIKEISGV